MYWYNKISIDMISTGNISMFFIQLFSFFHYAVMMFMHRVSPKVVMDMAERGRRVSIKDDRHDPTKP